MSNARAFSDYEMRDSFFVEGAKGPSEALIVLNAEFPETIGMFTPKDGKYVPMSYCLDCDSQWVREDGICGECGEDRLSKRVKWHYWFNKHA